MSILYKKKKFKMPKSELNGKTYAKPVILEIVSTKQLAEEISHSTTVTRADVIAVLTETAVKIKEHLLASQGVKLDELGIFKPALKSKAVLEDDDTKFTSANIYRTLIKYIPETTTTWTGTNAKGNHTGFRVKNLVEGAQYKLYSPEGSTSASSSSGSTTQP